MTPATGLIGVASCLALQGFFSGSQVALTAADREILQERADLGFRGPALALGLLRVEERLLGTCLIGATLALIGGATLTTTALGAPAWLAAAVYAPLAIVFGQALPQTVYRHHADLVAPWVAWPLHAAQIALRPVLALAGAWTRLLEIVTKTEVKRIKREDIMELLEEKSESIDPDDRRLIQRVFALPEVSVGQCMTPLVDVFALAEDASIREAIDLVIDGGHSRLPVYRDRVDNIVGVVGHRDLLQTDDELRSIAGLVRPVQFVPETQPIDRLLREMRTGNEHFAIVVDEYGGSVGLVTIEDLLEEIVGEIEDELDSEGPAIRRLAEHEWRVPARTEIEELEEELGIQLPKGPYATVAGLILAVLGRIPAPGQHVAVGAAEFLVEVANERSIQTVKVTLRSNP